jgi:hypothetical protein
VFESPIFPSLVAAGQMAVLGFGIDVLGSAVSAVRANDAPLSIKGILKGGIGTGVKTGIRCGLAELIELHVGCERGCLRFYDPLVAGVAAGTICGIPWGWKGMGTGAMEGARLAFLKMMLLGLRAFA